MSREKNKALIIAEYARGGTTTRNLGKKYGYSYTHVARIIKKGKIEKSRIELVESVKSAMDLKESLPLEVESLQEELRKARLQISLLEAMIDISDEQHGTNIRKKPGTRRS